MLSYNRGCLLIHAMRQSLARIVGATVAVILLGGCFRPLYAPSVNGISIREQLAAIELATINPDLRHHNRLAYYTQNELAFRLKGGSFDEGTKRYRLEVTVAENTTSTIVNTSTGNAEAVLLTGTASFKLFLLNGSEPIFSGQAVAASAYDHLTQRFAALRAARDAQIRVGKALADQLQTRLAAKLSSSSFVAER